MNKNYQNGRAREYKIKRGLEKQGFIVLRTAGSHGFCDLIAINKEQGIINFIQVKPKSMSEKKKTEITDAISVWLNKDFSCKFITISNLEVKQ